MKFLVALFLVAGLGYCSYPKAQVNFGTPNNTFTYTTINNGTGGIVGVPIPGSGLTINVATGSAALPLQNINQVPGATNVRLGDDSGINVPLGFTFPYWGQNFTNSWMYSNGIVSFSNGNIPGAGCCGGQRLSDLAASRNTTYNYMIAPLWTDLIDTTGQSTWVLKNSTSATYGWYNTREYGTNNQSSFEVNINSSGGVAVKYGGSFVSTNHMVTAGMTGNLANGEYFQYYYGNGFNIPTSNPVSWGTAGTYDQCLVNPLSSPTCPGYQAAYTSQQCTISALWDPTCPGYATAYFTQQCSLDPLYNSQCPGYANAYLTQQCSINPLYSTSCSGYQQAYHDRQCSLNTLAYTDCPGYAAAYLQQQCNANPLYSTTCSGYAEAYKSQQCSLNGLYDRTCPNYSTAYATKMLLEQQSSTTTTTTTTTTTESTTATTTPSTSSDGTVAVAVVKDSNVNNVITTTATSASPAQAATATVPLVQAPAATETKALAAVAVETKQEKTEEKKTNEPSPSNNTTTTTAQGNTSSNDKSSNEPRTARQELQEKREAAAKAKAVETGKNLANEMGKSASMEKQVEVQNVVIQAMGYSPAFEAYKFRMPDVPGYKPFTVYANQKTVDNRRVGNALFGPTDRLHSELVESQYKGGN